jgi:hypothetical protein
MPVRRVAADQDELPRSFALTEGLQQPEESLHRHVHDGFWDLLAGRQVHDMRDALHRAVDAAAIVDASLDDLDALGFGQRAVVTERPDAGFAPAGFREQRVDKIPADFSGGAGHQ